MLPRTANTAVAIAIVSLLLRFMADSFLSRRCGCSVRACSQFTLSPTFGLARCSSSTAQDVLPHHSAVEVTLVEQFVRALTCYHGSINISGEQTARRGS